MLPKLIYLHGFQSSCDSAKGTGLRAFFQDAGGDRAGGRVELPTLPPKPVAAREWMRERMANGPPVAGVLGSSLGGCYAHWMASEYGLPVTLINPATGAHELMRTYLGDNENPTTGVRFTLDEDDMQALQDMDSAAIVAPDDILCLLQKGDESLDWAVAAKRYADCQLQVEEGGSHGFENWEGALPRICRHFGVNPED